MQAGIRAFQRFRGRRENRGEKDGEERMKNRQKTIDLFEKIDYNTLILKKQESEVEL